MMDDNDQRKKDRKPRELVCKALEKAKHAESLFAKFQDLIFKCRKRQVPERVSGWSVGVGVLVGVWGHS